MNPTEHNPKRIEMDLSEYQQVDARLRQAKLYRDAGKKALDRAEKILHERTLLIGRISGAGHTVYDNPLQESFNSPRDWRDETRRALDKCQRQVDIIEHQLQRFEEKNPLEKQAAKVIHGVLGASTQYTLKEAERNHAQAVEVTERLKSIKSANVWRRFKFLLTGRI
jgi:hypothetical protein